MKPVLVKKVENKNDLKKFIMFQWKVYHGDPYWVPPLIMDRKKILSKEKNPFFKHAEADYFLAYRGDEIVGRIAAIKNDLHNSTHNDKVGFFGFFECLNDQQAADALLNEVKLWLKNRGLTEMRGPANPSSNDEYGLLIDGFEDSPRLLMTYNPRYYMELLDNYGLKKVKDLYAYKLVNEKVIGSDKVRRVAELAKQRYGLKLYELNLKDFQNDLKKIKYVYNRAWAPNWGFVPLTAEEIDAMAEDLRPLVEPSLVLFGEINNELIGFSLVMPDYNQIFKSMNGRLFPFNFLKLYTQKRKINWARVITLGLIPEHQKKGLDAVFYWEITKRAEKIGIKLGEASWILENNDMMNRGAVTLGGEIYKKYRIYEIPV